MAGGDPIAEAQALRQAQNADQGIAQLDLLTRFLELEHTFGEAVAIEASLLSGIALTGVSAIATGSAVALAPETGGLSATVIPFTLSGVAGGGFLIATGISGNIDIINTLFGTSIPNPFEGVEAIPRFPAFPGARD